MPTTAALRTTLFLDTYEKSEGCSNTPGLAQANWSTEAMWSVYIVRYIKARVGWATISVLFIFSLLKKNTHRVRAVTKNKWHKPDEKTGFGSCMSCLPTPTQKNANIAYSLPSYITSSNKCLSVSPWWHVRFVYDRRFPWLPVLVSSPVPSQGSRLSYSSPFRICWLLLKMACDEKKNILMNSLPVT